MLGLCLMACFFGLGRTIVGTEVVIRSGLNDFSPGELMRLLGWMALAVPGAAFVGWAIAPSLSAGVARVAARVDAMDARERAVGLAMLWILGIVCARLGRGLVLLDRPITDDENSVRFGAHVLLSGHCSVPSPGPGGIFPQLFLFTRAGQVTSFDFLGPQLVWVAELGANLNGLLIAALGALPLPALAFAVGRRRTAAWGLAAALLFVASPTGALFSITSHANTFSRGLLAVTVAVWAAERGSLGRWTVAGLALGAAGLCRPVEVLVLSLPLVILAALRAAQGSREDRVAMLGLALGALPFFALFAAHNHCVTGHALLHARFAPSEQAHNWNRPPTTALQNFGGSFAYNLLLLGVWFLGPLGLPLVALALLAVGGLARLADSRYARLVDLPRAAASFAVALALASALLVGSTVVTLQRHAVAEEVLASQLSPERLSRAVVLVPPKRWLLETVPFLRAVGSHERSWAPADPSLRDPVLLLHDSPAAEALARRRFPDRRLMRLQLLDARPWMRIVLVGPPPGPSAPPAP